MKKLVFRQGEIGFVVGGSIPGGLVRTPPKGNSLVLGHGESGNAHVLTGAVAWLHDATVEIDALMRDGALSTRSTVYVEVGSEGATVSHTDTAADRHNAFDIPEGIYAINIDEECPWWEEESRRAID